VHHEPAIPQAALDLLDKFRAERIRICAALDLPLDSHIDDVCEKIQETRAVVADMATELEQAMAEQIAICQVLGLDPDCEDGAPIKAISRVIEISETQADAIEHVLTRAQHDGDFGYHLCPATESFAKLCKADAAFKREPEAKARQFYSPVWSASEVREIKLGREVLELRHALELRGETIETRSCVHQEGCPEFMILDPGNAGK
jgi:hypothetical protein